MMENSVLAEAGSGVSSSSIQVSSNFKIRGAKINGTAVDICVNNYSDRYFIVVTEFQKLGTLISVEKDSARSEGEVKEVYSTRVLLGRDDDEFHVAARYLAEQLQLTKPAIFSLGLRDLQLPVLKATCQILRELL